MCRRMNDSSGSGADRLGRVMCIMACWCEGGMMDAYQYENVSGMSAGLPAAGIVMLALVNV